MKRYFYLSLALFVMLIASNVLAQNEPPASVTTKSGVVYYNGRELVSPFTFTGEGADTLFLNGIPYDPQRMPKGNLSPSSVSASCLSRHALNVTASERAKLGHSKEEGLQFMANVYGESSLVDSVVLYEHSICVYWHGEETGEEVLLPPLESGRFDRLTYHQQLQAEFWQVVNQGGLVAFGEKGYRVTSPQKWMPKTERAMEKIRTNVALVETDYASTALQNPDFRADYRAKHDGGLQKEPRKE